MKFKAPAKKLYNAVSSVSKVVSSKNALNILENFLFELKDEQLYITGSDSENSLTGRVDLSFSEGGGSFCLNMRQVVDLLKELPDQEVTVEVDESTLRVTISYPGGMYNLVAINADEYPHFTADENEGEPITFTCDASYISRAMEKTMFAVSTEDFRAIMQGILFDIKPDSVIFVATDTRKLVKYSDNRIKPGAEGSCVLPAKPAGVLKSVFNGKGEMKVVIRQKSATFTTEDFELKCSFLVGRYPDYTRVIPRSNTLHLTVDRLQMLQTVRRVAVFVDPGFGLITFKITPDRVYMRSSDTSLCSEAKDEVPCSFSGNELIIGFSAPYLLEILNVITTEDVLIDFGDAGRPGLFYPTENTEGTELIILLMPMTAGEF